MKQVQSDDRRTLAQGQPLVLKTTSHAHMFISLRLAKDPTKPSFTSLVTTMILQSIFKLTTLSSLILLLSPSLSQAFSLSQWLHHPPYPNGTLAEEIQCYSLPYGGIGFTSHIITYYTIAMLSAGRRPYAPWWRTKVGSLDIALSIIGLIVTVIISALTMVRCRNRWQFIAIAAWKPNLSVTFGFLSTHAAYYIWDHTLTEEPAPIQHHHIDIPYNPWMGLWHEKMAYEELRKVLFWLLFYIPGAAAGMIGLVSLVVETYGSNKHIQIITFAVSAAFILTTTCLAALFICALRIRAGWGVLVSFLLAVGIVGSVCSDWALAAIAGNLTGVPSSDNAALYWSYFVAKRLPFFSS
jgi:hypothetical protein